MSTSKDLAARLLRRELRGLLRGADALERPRRRLADAGLSSLAHEVFLLQEKLRAQARRLEAESTARNERGAT